MTIDERLERLVERHEALAQTVELMAAEQRELLEAQRKNEERFAQMATAMTQLIEVVRRPEDRLDRLEGRS